MTDGVKVKRVPCDSLRVYHNEKVGGLSTGSQQLVGVNLENVLHSAKNMPVGKCCIALPEEQDFMGGSS